MAFPIGDTRIPPLWPYLKQFPSGWVTTWSNLVYLIIVAVGWSSLSTLGGLVLTLAFGGLTTASALYHRIRECWSQMLDVAMVLSSIVALTSVTIVATTGAELASLLWPVLTALYWRSVHVLNATVKSDSGPSLLP